MTGACWSSGAHTAPQALLSHKVFLPAYSSSRLGMPFLCQERNRDSTSMRRPVRRSRRGTNRAGFCEKGSASLLLFPHFTHYTAEGRNSYYLFLSHQTGSILAVCLSNSSDLLRPLCSVSSKVTTGFCNRLGLRRRPDEHTVFMYRRNSGAPGRAPCRQLRQKALFASQRSDIVFEPPHRDANGLDPDIP